MSSLFGSENGARLDERTALSRHRSAMLEQAEPASRRSVRESMPAVTAPASGATAARAAPRPSSDTGPLPGSRSGRRKKGLFRRSGIIFPAIGVAALIVAIVAVASYLISPIGRGASGLAPMFDTLTHSKSVALLESERQQLIVMNAAAGTLSDAAKPSKVSPSAVMASAAAANQATASNAAGPGSSHSGSQQGVQPPAPDPGTPQQNRDDLPPSSAHNPAAGCACL